MNAKTLPGEVFFNCVRVSTCKICCGRDMQNNVLVKLKDIGKVCYFFEGVSLSVTSVRLQT